MLAKWFLLHMLSYKKRALISVCYAVQEISYKCCSAFSVSDFNAAETSNLSKYFIIPNSPIRHIQYLTRDNL